jgi:hypothetical protein
MSVNQLRSRVLSVLRTKECLQIRFRIGDVHIERFMYLYLAGAITDNHVQLTVGDGHNYDDTTNTITYDSDSPDRPTIVHEATHAVIDGTHKGKIITKGNHEAAAYLAEALFSLYSGDDDNVNYSVPHLAPPLFDLARRVQAFNEQNPSGLFRCPTGDLMELVAIMSAAPYAGNMSSARTMGGWGD